MAKLLMAATFAGGLVMAGTAGASASAHKPPSGGATGTATCAVMGVVDFSPALQKGATGNSQVTLHAQSVRCTASGIHHRTTGHISASLGTIASNTCTLPASAPSFTGLSVRWTPTSQVKKSMVSSTTTGTVTTLSDGRGQVAYTALSVTGSFATSSGTATLTTRGTVADLEAACNDTSASGGVSGVGFTGSVTF